MRDRVNSVVTKVTTCEYSVSAFANVYRRRSNAKQPTSTVSSSHETFQREGAKSNAHVGKKFEQDAANFLAKSEGWVLQSEVEIPVGFDRKKWHAFDLVCENPNVIIECKSHKWTKGGNVPSAKITTWNEAMFYFSLAPPDYRKILFVLRDARYGHGETLAAYYLRTHGHLIPPGVELWEYDETADNATRIK